MISSKQEFQHWKRRQDKQPKTINIEVQQGNGSYNVTFDPNLPCEDCFNERTEKYKLGSYGRKGDEFGVCLKHYYQKTWLGKKVLITVREWF